jgi:hypothetical protein
VCRSRVAGCLAAIRRNSVNLAPENSSCTAWRAQQVGGKLYPVERWWREAAWPGCPSELLIDASLKSRKRGAELSRSTKLAVVIGAAVVALAGFLWFLAARTGVAREYVAGRIAGGFREQGLILESQSTGIGLFGPAVVLHDVVIRAERAADLPPILRASEIRLNLGWGALLGREHALSRVVIENPQVHAVITAQGRSNLPAATGNGEARRAAIPDIRAAGGSLRLENRRDRVFAHLPQWRLSVQPRSGTMEARVRFDAREQGTIAIGDRQTGVSGIDLDAMVREVGAEIRKLELTTQAGRITATGTANLEKEPALDVRGDLMLSLPQFTTLAGLPQAATGRLSGSYTAAGPLDRLRIQSDLRGDRIAIPGFEQPVIKADVAYLPRQDRIRVESLAVSASSADLAANGTLALRAGERSSLQARIIRANLQQITAALAAPYLLASRGTGTLQAQWPGMQFSEAGGAVDLQLMALRPSPAERVLPASGPLTVASQNRQLRISTNGLSALSAQWNGNVTVAPSGSLGGSVSGRTADVGAMLPAIQSLLGRRQPLLPVQARGGATFTAGLGGTVQRPTADLNVRAPSLNVGRLQNTDFTARAFYTSQQLDIGQADLRWLGQTISLRGRMGLGSEAAPLDLTARAQGSAAAALFGGVRMPAIPGLPQIGLQAHIGGTTAAPRVTISEAGAVGL